MTVNAACPAANEIAAGARPANRTANGSSTHSSVVLVPMSRTSTPPTTKPGDGAQQAAEHVLTGAQRVRAQHRQRAEHDPERVLHAGEVGDEHGEAEADGAAHAVAAATSEWRSTWAPARSCAADSGPASPTGWRPSSCSSQLRRSAAAARSMFCAICETTKLSSCARKPGSSAEITSRRPSAPAAHGGAALQLARAARAARRAPRAAPRRDRSGASSRSAPRSSTVGRGALHGAGRAVDRGRRRRRRRVHDDRVEPAQLVDQAHDRPGGGAQPGRAVRRREEHRVQRLDRVVGPRDRGVALGRRRLGVAAEEVGDLRAQPRRQRPAARDRRGAHRIARRRRPQQRDREQRRRRRERPSRPGDRGSPSRARAARPAG